MSRACTPCEAASLIALGALSRRGDIPAFRSREQVFLPHFFILISKTFVLCCHETSLHISTAIVSENYLSGLARDSLCEKEYLVVRKGPMYDLSATTGRIEAVKQILGLMRYLNRSTLSSSGT
jgi:hypothetical protein